MLSASITRLCGALFVAGGPYGTRETRMAAAIRVVLQWLSAMRRLAPWLRAPPNESCVTDEHARPLFLETLPGKIGSVHIAQSMILLGNVSIGAVRLSNPDAVPHVKGLLEDKYPQRAQGVMPAVVCIDADLGPWIMCNVVIVYCGSGRRVQCFNPGETRSQVSTSSSVCV